jgi:transposase-like protein
MPARRLGDPRLVVSDAAPGLIKAIEACFPRSARQRCLDHRMRNLAAKVSEDQWLDLKARAQAAYQAPSQAIARQTDSREAKTAGGSSTDAFAHIFRQEANYRTKRPVRLVRPVRPLLAAHGAPIILCCRI